MPSSASSWGRGLAPERRPLEPAVAEQADERDALHVVLLRERRLLVDVHLHDLVGALAHRRDLLDDRADLAARPAPRRPEVDDHRHVGAEHLGRRSSRWSPPSPGLGRRLGQRLASGARRRAPASSHALRLLHALERDLVPHRVLAVDDRDARLDAAPRPARGCRLTGIIGSSVPCWSSTGTSRRALEVDAEEARRHERAHREHARGSRCARDGPSAEREREPAALGEPADDRLRARRSRARRTRRRAGRRPRRARRRRRRRCRRARPRPCRTTRTRAAPRRGPRGSTVAKRPSGSR